MQFKLGDFNRKHDYAEAYQPDNFKLAFAKVTKDTVVGRHPPVKCRDFLSDTLLWKAKAIPKANIYGYSFAGPINRDVRLLVFNVTHPENISAINDIEVKYNVEKSTIHETTEKGTYLVKGSSFWQRNTVKMSLFTFLLRAYLGRNVKNLLGEIQSLHPLGETITSLEGAIEKVMTMKPTETPYVLKKDPLSLGKTTVHDLSGFVSYLVFPDNYKV